MAGVVVVAAVAGVVVVAVMVVVAAVAEVVVVAAVAIDKGNIYKHVFHKHQYI